MTRTIGVACGLLTFSAMTLIGLHAGNPPTIILKRAVVGLFAGFALGVLLGSIGWYVVRDSVPAPEKLAGSGPRSDATETKSGTAQDANEDRPRSAAETRREGAVRAA